MQNERTNWRKGGERWGEKTVGKGSDSLIVDCNKLKMEEKLRFMGNYKNLTKCFLLLSFRSVFCLLFFCYLRRRIYRVFLSAFLQLFFVSSPPLQRDFFAFFVHEFFIFCFNWKSWYFLLLSHLIFFCKTYFHQKNEPNKNFSSRKRFFCVLCLVKEISIPSLGKRNKWCWEKHISRLVTTTKNFKRFVYGVFFCRGSESVSDTYRIAGFAHWARWAAIASESHRSGQTHRSLIALGSSVAFFAVQSSRANKAMRSRQSYCDKNHQH